MARLELNKVMLCGNLTHAPEMKFTRTGTPVTNFSLALNRTSKSTTGEIKKSTDFIRVVAWNKTAENCKTYLVKGQQVYVEGSLRSRQWETKDGKKATSLEVVATRVQFLDKPKSETGAGAAAAAPDAETSESVFDDDTAADHEAPPSDNDVPF